MNQKRFELREPANTKEWDALHRLRREGLFAEHFPGLEYDPSHPDDQQQQNHPLVLVANDQVVGTVRLDELDLNRMAVRLVVIDALARGQGVGTELMKQVEKYAITRGCSQLHLCSIAPSVNFYQKMGFVPSEDFEERKGSPSSSSDQVPMTKILGK